MKNQASNTNKNIDQSDAKGSPDAAARLNAIIETAIDGIITIDERGIVETANPAACKLFQYALSEMTGHNISMLMPSPNRENHDGYMSNYMTSGVKKIIGIGREVMGLRKDGTLFPFWLSVSEVWLGEKRVFTGIIHDLTEQKKAEEALSKLNQDLENIVSERTDKLSAVVNKLLATNQQLQIEILERKAAEEALISSQEQLRVTQHILQQITDNYPDGAISVVDKALNYVFTGGEIHQKLAQNVEKLIGTRLFPFLSDAAWATLRTDLHRVFDGHFLQDYELPEGVRGYVFSIDAFPLKDVDGSINRVAVFLRNVSDLKKVEAELREALKKERELGELKTRFVSMASHEFRTPLSTVLSSASLAVQYKLTEQQDKRERHFQKIQSAVATLTNILNDFLSLSRLEEGKVDIQWSEVDFSAFCHEMAEEMNPLLKPRQHIFIRHGNSPLVFNTDKNLLKLILINLLTNASKYSDEGAEIHCIVKKEGDKLRIDIIDQGIGIPDADKPHLFDRFFRASNAVNIKGTGLGLNIVKRYVALLGGSISYESTLGKGSTFSVEFPI